MALLNPFRRVLLLHGRQLPRIFPAVRLSNVGNDQQAQKDDLEFRKRLKDLPDTDRFGAFSDRPAVTPDAIEDGPDIEAELDSHVPLAVHRRPHDRPWYFRRIKALLAEGRPKDAVNVLYTRMLVEDRVKPTRYIYNMVMSIHRDYGEVEEAQKLFYMMKSYRCKPNNLTHGLLFEACGNADDLALGSEIATRIYLSLPQEGLAHSIYSAALRGFSKTKNLPMTMRALDDMLLRGRFRPTEFDLRSALEACRSDPDAGAGLALQVWRRFRQIRRCEFKDYHYTLLLQCLLGCGFGNVNTAVESIASDGEKFDYRALMARQPVPSGKEVLKQDETDALDVRVEEVFDEKLILSSPINLLSLEHPVPDQESLLSILEMSKPAPHRHLALLGGLEGLIKTMAADGVQINKFHVSQLYRRIPSGNPTIDNALRIVADNIDETDTVLQNSFLSTRTLSEDQIKSEIRDRGMQPDLVTYGILSRHANTIPRIHSFFNQLASAGLNANNVMCLNMMISCELDFNAKSYVLDMMLKHDISPSAKMIETIERNIHEVRQHVIKTELSQKSPSFNIPFHVFCIKYANWLKKVALHPNDVQKLKENV